MAAPKLLVKDYYYVFLVPFPRSWILFFSFFFLGIVLRFSLLLICFRHLDIFIHVFLFFLRFSQRSLGCPWTLWKKKNSLVSSVSLFFLPLSVYHFLSYIRTYIFPSFPNRHIFIHFSSRRVEFHWSICVSGSQHNFFPVHVVRTKLKGMYRCLTHAATYSFIVTFVWWSLCVRDLEQRLLIKVSCYANIYRSIGMRFQSKPWTKMLLRIKRGMIVK